ncbi:MAG: hypothetical protein GWO24_30740, partial [Akkermansiaceae bacterium]|nr:hypothetical protein [Akkermansiaceae bacterium]
MIPIRRACLLLPGLLLAPPAPAQHDVQRNAVQQIAVGQFDKAGQIL